MGYRLEGVDLTLREPLELLSEGVTFGTVQLPPGGAPMRKRPADTLVSPR